MPPSVSCVPRSTPPARTSQQHVRASLPPIPKRTMPGLEWRERRDLALEAVDVARLAGDDTAFVEVLTTTFLSTGDPGVSRSDDRRCRAGGRDRRPARRPVSALHHSVPADLGPIPTRRPRRGTHRDRRHGNARRPTRTAQRTLDGCTRPYRWIVARRSRRRRRTGQPTHAGTRHQRRENPKRSQPSAAILYVIRQHQGRVDEMADLFIDAARDNPSIAVTAGDASRSFCARSAVPAKRVNGSPTKPASGFDFPHDTTYLAALTFLVEAAALTRHEESAHASCSNSSPRSPPM